MNRNEIRLTFGVYSPPFHRNLSGDFRYETCKRTDKHDLKHKYLCTPILIAVDPVSLLRGIWQWTPPPPLPTPEALTCRVINKRLVRAMYTLPIRYPLVSTVRQMWREFSFHPHNNKLQRSRYKLHTAQPELIYDRK